MKKLWITLGMILLIAVSAGAGALVTYSKLNVVFAEQLTEIYNSKVTSKTAEVQEYLDTYFVGEADDAVLADAAASAMVDAIQDEWSYYIPAASYDLYLEQMNNEYVGIGVTITQTEEMDGLTVQDVTPGSPAEEADIQVFDVIIEVEGESVAGKDLNTVRDLVRGESGSFVNLTLLRGENRLSVNVERRLVEAVVASGKMLEGNIGYISITNFDLKCADQTIAAIESLVNQGAEALIFDVRNNPGGYKTELVKVLDYLLPEGELFRMVSSTGEEMVDRSGPTCLDIPMAVLVNLDSYSAAEFFAAALQEYDAAEIVGTRTYGKGYYQLTYELSDGSAIVLSSGTYYTPNGISLAGVGITPDVELDLDPEDVMELYYHRLDPELDEQLQAALELFR